MTFPPLAPPLRGLWAPASLYGAHNPRQRGPLPLYEDSHSRSSPTASRTAKERAGNDRQARYGARRDLVNVLKGSTPRFAWDYAAEAATLSEEEAEYEAYFASAKTHGYAWMVPEGKLMNQEGEQEDEAINEEARQAAANAATELERANNAAQQAIEAVAMAEDTSTNPEDASMAGTSPRRRRRRQAGATRNRERDGQNRRDSASAPMPPGPPAGVETTSAMSTAMSGSGRRASGSGRPSMTRQGSTNRAPNSRDSVGTVARAPPRTSSARYSMSSSGGGSGGGSGSAALPRYAGAMRRTSSGGTGPPVPAAESSSAAAIPHVVANSRVQRGRRVSAGGGGGRDLDADIPEAEEVSYGAGEGSAASGYNGPDLDEELTDLDELEDGSFAEEEEEEVEDADNVADGQGSEGEIPRVRSTRAPRRMSPPDYERNSPNLDEEDDENVDIHEGSTDMDIGA